MYNSSSTANASELVNATTPNTERLAEPPELFTVYIQFAAILTLVVVTVTGNLLLLAIVFRSPQLRSTVSNALIVNLAVADSLVGLFVLPAFAATVLDGRPPGETAAPGLCSTSQTTNVHLLLLRGISLTPRVPAGSCPVRHHYVVASLTP